MYIASYSNNVYYECILYETQHEKTMLMYTKYTFLHYFNYLIFLCKLYKFCSSYWILVLDDYITKPYSERYWPHLLLLLLSVHVFSWHHTYDVMVHNNVQWGALGSTLKLSANYTYVFISSYYLTTVSNIQCTECSVLMTLWTPSLRQLLATYYIQ